MNTCCCCGKPAQMSQPNTSLPEYTNHFCWDCVSTPNLVLDPVRPPDVDPEEWDDYLAYRLAAVNGEARYFGPDEEVCMVLCMVVGKPR